MNAPSGTLQGRRVLVTRPAHQADQLCRLIETRGGTAVRLPLLTIAPVPHGGALRKRMEEAASWNGWIFTSANAVQHARTIWPMDWPAPLWAVGPATAAALESGGAVASVPQSAYSSEALLQLPALQNVSGQRFLIVTGEEGLAVIAPTLQSKGAQAEVLEVYRRIPLPYTEDRVLSALRGSSPLIVTSNAALAHLLRLTPAASQAGLLRKTLVVASERMLENARSLGFRSVVAPQKMSDAALVELIEQTVPADD